MQTTSQTSILLVESTSFLNNTKTKDGSCLFFNNAGQCVQNRVCSTSCYITGGNGHHSKVDVSDTQNTTNYVNLTTISPCGKERTGYGCLYHYYGEQQASNVNISESKSIQWSALVFYYGSAPSYTKFCSFKNCTSSLYCLGLYTTPSQLSFSNVIRNTASHCIRMQHFQLTVEDCVIKENKGRYLFSNDGGSAWIDVIHCIVTENNYGSDFSSGVVKTENMKTDKVDIIFAHFNTEACKIDFEEKYQTEQIKYFFLSCFYKCVFLPVIL